MTQISLSAQESPAIDPETPQEPDALVVRAVAEDKGIRQWVVTGSITPGYLAEIVNLRDVENAAVEQRAALLDASRRVDALRDAGPKYPVFGYLLPWERRRSRAAFNTELAGANRDLEKARQVMDEAVLGDVKRQLRAAASQNRSDLFSTSLPSLEHESLAEIERAAAVVTDSSRQLNHLVEEMPGGSIGLAGPRGAGKSTLIRVACSSGQRDSALGVVVSAPVEFSAREFILHLFAKVCREVLGREAVEKLRVPDPLSPRRRPALTARVLLATCVGAVFAGTLLILNSTLSIFSGVSSETIWGAVILAIGIMAFVVLSLSRTVSIGPLRISFEPHFNRRFSAPVTELATRRLKDIWFQQTFTSGWSGSLKLPVGVEGGLSGSEELARQQMSMPDIVAELRELIEEIAKAPTTDSNDESPTRRSVRIGIDELDKIDSPKNAKRFMNEIKVLFGIPDCFFFVSVSEDAMSDFERRGLPFRDVFDSSFDDIVRVGYLDAPSAIELVQGRVVGMPIPFILLGHCMAGGLARDLIRVARDIAGLAPTSNSTEAGLSGMCSTLVGLDVKGKAEANVFACGRFGPSPDVIRLQSWFREMSSTPVSRDFLLDLCENAERDLGFLRDTGVEDEDGTREPAALATEFLAFCLFAATLLEYFSETRSPKEFETAVPGIGDSPIDRLAKARQAFSISPRAAWDSVVGFRKAAGLTRNPEFPRLAG